MNQRADLRFVLGGAEGNIGEGVAAEVPTLHGEEIGAARTNTNTNAM
jgi:hypothetical protein